MKKGVWWVYIIAAIAFFIASFIYIGEKRYSLGTTNFMLGIVNMLIAKNQYHRSRKVTKGIPEGDFNELNLELRELIAEGNRVKAIKRYRSFTGAGLKEAYDYVESMINDKRHM